MLQQWLSSAGPLQKSSLGIHLFWAGASKNEAWQRENCTCRNWATVQRRDESTARNFILKEFDRTPSTIARCVAQATVGQEISLNFKAGLFHKDENCVGNSIAFGKAPGREADGQPISGSVRQAFSQAGGWASRQASKQAETHSLAFFSVTEYIYKQRGTPAALEQLAIEW